MPNIRQCSFSSFLETDFGQLIDLAYDAALDEPSWQNFIDAFSRVFGGATGMMYCLDRQRSGQAADAVFSRNNDLSLNTPSDAERYLGHNRISNALYIQDVVGQVALTDRPHRRAPDVSSLLNSEFEPPSAYFRMPLCVGSRRTVTLALAPHARVLGKRRRGYLQRLQLLSPHLVRAVKLSFLADDARTTRASSINVLESFQVSAFILDSQDRIVTMNRHAETFLSTQHVLTLDRFRQLSAFASDQSKMLKCTLANSRLSSPTGPSTPIKLSSVQAKGEYLIWVIPLSPGLRVEPEIERKCRLQLLGVEKTTANVLVLACKIDKSASVSQEILMANFGLSRTEARLSATLAAGRSLADYARENGVSRNTARNQLSTVFEKTGARRQAELVAHIARFYPLPAN